MSESRIASVAPKATGTPASSMKRAGSAAMTNTAATDPFAAMLAQSVESLDTSAKNEADAGTKNGNPAPDASTTTANATDASAANTATPSAPEATAIDPSAAGVTQTPATPADQPAAVVTADGAQVGATLPTETTGRIDLAIANTSAQPIATAPSTDDAEHPATTAAPALAARRAHGAAVSALASSMSNTVRTDTSAAATEALQLDAPQSNEFGLQRAASRADASANFTERLTAKLDAASASVGSAQPGPNPNGGVAGAGSAPGFGIQSYEVAPQSPTFDLAAPIDTPAWPHQLGHVVRIMSRDEVSRAEVRVHPAELGPIEVRLAIEGESAAIEFTVTSPETRALLEAHMPKLREVLEASGLQLSQSSVQSGPERDARNASTSSEPRSGSNNGRDPQGKATESVEGFTEIRLRQRTDRLVDVFA